MYSHIFPKLPVGKKEPSSYLLRSMVSRSLSDANAHRNARFICIIPSLQKNLEQRVKEAEKEKRNFSLLPLWHSSRRRRRVIFLALQFPLLGSPRLGLFCSAICTVALKPLSGPSQLPLFFPSFPNIKRPLVQHVQQKDLNSFAISH